jgi:hypothetical protein
MDTTLRKIANPTPAIAVEAMSSSENSRFYRTLDYYNSKIVNGILYLKKSKPPERDKKD